MKVCKSLKCLPVRRFQLHSEKLTARRFSAAVQLQLPSVSVSARGPAGLYEEDNFLKEDVVNFCPAVRPDVKLWSSRDAFL